MAEVSLIINHCIRKSVPPTHCKQGHEYTVADFKPNGERVCRRCKKARAIERRKRAIASGVPPRDYSREHRTRKERHLRDKEVADRARSYQVGWLKRAMEDPQFRAARNRRQCEVRKQRCSTDPAYHLKINMASAFRSALRTRTGSAFLFNAAGYTVAQLVEHLERQFMPGMTWDNYGQWHVGHIQPVASFNYETAEDPEFKACWALSNLRPLWAEDNLRKADRRLHLL
jgi:hypothetical protein